jgi:nucleoside-diphosphate-sugar epimerase
MNYILAGIEPMPIAKQLKETILRYLPDARLSFSPDPLAMAFHKMSQGVRWDETFAAREWDWKVRYSLDEMVKDFICELTGHPSWYI